MKTTMTVMEMTATFRPTSRQTFRKAMTNTYPCLKSERAINKPPRSKKKNPRMQSPRKSLVIQTKRRRNWRLMAQSKATVCPVLFATSSSALKPSWMLIYPALISSKSWKLTKRWRRLWTLSGPCSCPSGSLTKASKKTLPTPKSKRFASFVGNSVTALKIRPNI